MSSAFEAPAKRPGGPYDLATDPAGYDHLTYDGTKGGFGLDYRGLGMRLQELLTGETLKTDPWHVENGTEQGFLDVVDAVDLAAMRVAPLNYPAASLDLLMNAVEPTDTLPFVHVHTERWAEYLVSIYSGVSALEPEVWPGR